MSLMEIQFQSKFGRIYVCIQSMLVECHTIIEWIVQLFIINFSLLGVMNVL